MQNCVLDLPTYILVSAIIACATDFYPLLIAPSYFKERVCTLSSTLFRIFGQSHGCLKADIFLGSVRSAEFCGITFIINLHIIMFMLSHLQQNSHVMNNMHTTICPIQLQCNLNKLYLAYNVYVHFLLQSTPP